MSEIQSEIAEGKQQSLDKMWCVDQGEKKKGGCINLEQSLQFQDYLRNLVEVFIGKMIDMGSMDEPLVEMIQKIQQAYGEIEVFDRSATTKVNKIIKSIPDISALAWRKHLQGITILSQEDYSDIVDVAFSTKLAQDGHIMSKLERRTFITSTLMDEENKQVMSKCQ